MEDLTQDNIDIEWSEASGANKANWDERVEGHVQAYGLQAFRDDPECISSVVSEDKPVLEQFLPGHSFDGLKLCHLQCHIGTDTVSFTRLGASVTGVDFSEPALEAAQSFAQDIGAHVRWVQGDVLEAASLVGDTFDVVYTSIGTITWLNDLDKWAQQISELLVPGGVFYIRDGHPSLFTIDESTMPPVVAYRYFPNGLAQSWESDETYAGDAKIENKQTYEYPHSISEILMALIGAGLRIEAFLEGDSLPWEFSPHMTVNEAGNHEWVDHLKSAIPCTFTVVARKA